MRAITPAVTRAAAVGTAVAAVGVLVFTALVNSQSGNAPRAAASSSPTRPVTPVPVSTLPGVEPSKSAPPHVTAAQKRSWLKRLTGTWTRDTKNTYFRFHKDGSGEWQAFGQSLWTGTATPRDARHFDLSDPDGHGGAYWQVTLLGGGKLLFAGTRQTFVRS
ncbi:hypothetical protein [Actinomadura sp. DC4]|uniref:hypothetical protein n=1 Tax=Actinomadura sp. DC4 TaxID=3055069 RepID=UPI0025B26002|nr:hypothetical protein [Actinomadura sp. DC4]MDN3355430.1 hypothetical protein [Actinomadura sp. DC4]